MVVGRWSLRYKRCWSKRQVLIRAARCRGSTRAVWISADLAVAAAVVSAARGRPIDGDVVLCGEIGLSGELRQVGDTARRLSEAARLGFRRAIVPKGRAARLDGIDVRPVSSLAEALDALGLLGDVERS